MNQNQIDALTAIADMAVRFSHRARANDAAAFEALAKEIRSVAGESQKVEQRFSFSHYELATLRDACKKRIDRAGQKIKYWSAKDGSKEITSLVGVEEKRISDLNQLVAKIDLQCKPVNKF